MFRPYHQPISFLLLMFSTTIINANNLIHTESAHVHGQAELTIAFEGNQLVIEFQSPAINIVGFEHKADNIEQINRVKDSEAILTRGQKLFDFMGTDCQLHEQNVDISSIQSDKHDEHNHHKHEHEHNKVQRNHSEVLAHYQFNCSNAKQLKSFSTNMFDAFPSIELLEVQWVTDTAQGSTTLSHKERQVSLGL